MSQNPDVKLLEKQIVELHKELSVTKFRLEALLRLIVIDNRNPYQLDDLLNGFNKYVDFQREIIRLWDISDLDKRVDEAYAYNKQAGHGYHIYADDLKVIENSGGYINYETALKLFTMPCSKLLYDYLSKLIHRYKNNKIEKLDEPFPEALTAWGK